jgi:hypothetical protein
MANAQLGCARYAGELLFTDLGDSIFGRAFFAEAGKQEKNPR